MTILTLPSWNKCSELSNSEGGGDPITQFIYDNEPMLRSEAIEFRRKFCDALNYYKYKFSHTYDDPFTEPENHEEGRSDVDCQCSPPEQRTTTPTSTGEAEREPLGSSPFVPHGQDYRSSDQRNDDCAPRECIRGNCENA